MEVLSGLNLEEIENITTKLGASKFRARQIHNWIYLKSVKDIDEMKDLQRKTSPVNIRKSGKDIHDCCKTP